MRRVELEWLADGYRIRDLAGRRRRLELYPICIPLVVGLEQLSKGAEGLLLGLTWLLPQWHHSLFFSENLFLLGGGADLPQSGPLVKAARVVRIVV